METANTCEIEIRKLIAGPRIAHVWTIGLDANRRLDAVAIRPFDLIEESTESASFVGVDHLDK